MAASSSSWAAARCVTGRWPRPAAQHTCTYFIGWFIESQCDLCFFLCYRICLLVSFSLLPPCDNLVCHHTRQQSAATGSSFVSALLARDRLEKGLALGGCDNLSGRCRRLCAFGPPIIISTVRLRCPLGGWPMQAAARPQTVVPPSAEDPEGIGLASVFWGRTATAPAGAAPRAGPAVSGVAVSAQGSQVVHRGFRWHGRSGVRYIFIQNCPSVSFIRKANFLPYGAPRATRDGGADLWLLSGVQFVLGMVQHALYLTSCDYLFLWSGNMNSSFGIHGLLNRSALEPLCPELGLAKRGFPSSPGSVQSLCYVPARPVHACLGRCQQNQSLMHNTQCCGHGWHRARTVVVLRGVGGQVVLHLQVYFFRCPAQACSKGCKSRSDGGQPQFVHHGLSFVRRVLFPFSQARTRLDWSLVPRHHGGSSTHPPDTTTGGLGQVQDEVH